ncbi:histidine--tRNA ligase [Oscillospiraceae bacterium MB08-C2-2]|nr:histidine--tRNA ligase [Oscillospiraceae bacterium MB08-C2-2]
MAQKIQSIRGTRDVFPPDSAKWQYVESKALEVARRFGIEEIRVPTIEKTELFTRSVGETTDVVQKEMYTFDKGKESITLRPEGTAGTVRAVMENGLLGGALPLKLCYLVSCFRHERPQAGRLREFHQFGAEYFGAASPSADAEVIHLAAQVLEELGIGGVSLHINSIGCPKCRPGYNQKLREYFGAYREQLCETCKDRLERNPLRLLDCKEEGCQAIAKDAPLILDHLCEECSDHFDGLKVRLESMGLPYSINPKIVRGLDYYTKTVFEFITDTIGAQGTVCGGGRYDGLVSEMGGPATPALGFGMGLERIIMVMEAAGVPLPGPKAPLLYIGSIGEKAERFALELTAQLRRAGLPVQCDIMGRSVKAQMKYADKLGARFSCILGDNELTEGSAQIKEMSTGESSATALTVEGIVERIASNLSGEKGE